MVSSTLMLTAAACVPVGALVGGLLWLDARERRWSNRPAYQFIVAGVVVFVPLVLVIVKIVAGGFNAPGGGFN